MSLFEEIVKLKQRQGKNAFWDSVYGPYSMLNGIDKKNLSPQTLRSIQLGIIKKEMQTNARLKQANDFIKNLPLYNSAETENMAANAIFSKIATILNAPFSSGNQSVRTMSDKVAQLNQLLQTINVNLPIPPSIIQQLSTNSIITKNNMYQYRAEKAKLFEDIVAAYFSANGLGKAIGTGSWGKISDNNRQLVTDVFVFLNGNSNRMKGKYTPYQKSGYWKADMHRATNGIGVAVQSELDDFIATMEKLNGQSNIGISIDDELSDMLDTYSSLKVQVKSGINQSVLNQNSRNAIALGDFGDYRLNLLSDLYERDRKNNFIYLYKNPKDSDTLTAYGNYLLSINIAQTAVAQSNDIYFTEHGFETIYDWMKNRQVYLKFLKGIKLNAQLLDKKRQYNFRSI